MPFVKQSTDARILPPVMLIRVAMGVDTREIARAKAVALVMGVLKASKALPPELMAQVALVAVLTSLAFVFGCAPTVKVAAPDEPIVINLNVKIQHEILIKVDNQLDDLFADNEDLFGDSE